MMHETTALGIPCKVMVQFNRAYHGSREHGTGVPLEPDEPAFYEVVAIYDRKGYKANWIWNKLEKEGMIEGFENQVDEELMNG